MKLKSLPQMSRTGFLFTFQNKFQIYSEKNILRAQGIERGEDRDDGRFVVGGGTGVNAPVVLVRICRAVACFREGNAFAARFNRFIPQYRLKRGFIGPSGRIDRLAVVMRV